MKANKAMDGQPKIELAVEKVSPKTMTIKNEDSVIIMDPKICTIW